MIADRVFFPCDVSFERGILSPVVRKGYLLILIDNDL